MTDVEMVRTCWLSIEGDLDYNPHVDFNLDGIVSIKDATIIGINWLKKWESQQLLENNIYKSTSLKIYSLLQFIEASRPCK